MYNDTRVPRLFYSMLPEDEQADHCTECGECDELCPQDIEISELLKKAHDLLGPNK